MIDPNFHYEKFEKNITITYDKHFPEQCVKFNKYKHKRSNWITSGKLKSIEFRDKLYKLLKCVLWKKLAKSINTANKPPFNAYLIPCAASFNFAYTKPDDIEKITKSQTLIIPFCYNLKYVWNKTPRFEVVFFPSIIVFCRCYMCRTTGVCSWTIFILIVH